MPQHRLNYVIYLRIRPVFIHTTLGPRPQTNFYVERSRLEIQKKAFSRIGTKLWNEIPCSLRELPQPSIKKGIQSVLLSIFEEVDSFIDINQIVSKVNPQA